MLNNYAEFTYNRHLYKFYSLTRDDKIHVESHQKDKNFYEWYVLEYIRKMNLRGVYVDVGANIGNHSVYFACECPSTEVISIEMVPEVFEILKENCRLNINKPHTLINCAVVDLPRMVSHEPILSYRVGSTKVKENLDGNIQGDTLDNILDSITNIAVIKIDIESYEVFALRGAINILKREIPLIVTEAQDDKEFNAYKEIMYGAGYKVICKETRGTPLYFWQPTKTGV